MPPAKVKNAPGLDVAFSPCTPSVLYPGQTLSGTVNLSTTQDSVSIGSVTVTFYGRSKVKIFQNYGQSSAVYRSRATFFNIEQEIFSSDYTYGPGDHSWPFSIQLPFVADESCLKGKKRDNFKRHNDFLGNEIVDVVEDELPPPMFYYHGMWGRAAWGYVEYVLEATVKEAKSAHTIRSPQARTTVRPLNFQPGRREDVLTNYAMQTLKQQVVLKSSRLSDAGNTLTPSTSNPDVNGGLTPSTSNDPVLRTGRPTSPLRGLFSKISLSSSTPRLTLDCTVSYPTVLQVYHPDAVPFHLTITPDLGLQSTTIDQASLPTIRIKSFDFRVMCTTRVRALTGLWREHDGKTVALRLAKDVPLNHTLQLSAATSLAAPRDEKSSSSEKGPTAGFANTLPSSYSANNNTINLSTLHPLRLTSAKLGRIHEPILNPSFKTYNITRLYGLKWAIEIDIITPSGKVFTEKIKGEVPRGGVTVRGIPDGLRAEVEGEGDGGLVEYEALESGRVRDDDEDEDDDEDGEGGEDRSGGDNEDGDGRDEKKGLKGLLRRSHDGGSKAASKKTSKKEYAAEDRAAAARAREKDDEHGPHGEQLPRYEA